ncbi:hypothetical protein LDENG_00253990 [Lucifuga dentata]|nr:hypothetical protein LDENG_00253990 [Lucifuga dentata]
MLQVFVVLKGEPSPQSEVADLWSRFIFFRISLRVTVGFLVTSLTKARFEGRMNAARSREVLEENLLQRGQRPQTGVMVHLSARQRPEASSQDNAGATSGQVSDCP